MYNQDGPPGFDTKHARIAQVVTDIFLTPGIDLRLASGSKGLKYQNDSVILRSMTSADIKI